MDRLENASAKEKSQYSPKDEKDFSPVRLVLSLLGVFVGYRLFSWASGMYLLRALPSSPDRVTFVANLVYPATAIFILLELLVVLWMYRPVARLLGSTPWGAGSRGSGT